MSAGADPRIVPRSTKIRTIDLQGAHRESQCASGARPQSGQTTAVAISVGLGVAAAAFLFVYLPYLNGKEEDAQRAVLEARKAAEMAAKQAADERARAAAAEAELAIARRGPLSGASSKPGKP